MHLPNFIFSLAVAVVLTISSPVARASELRWLDLTNSSLTVRGLPWFNENSGALVRLPKRSKDQFRPVVWNLAQDTSGARITFKSNTRKVAVKVQYPSPPNMANMQAYGQTGVGLYVDGQYLSTVIAGRDVTAEDIGESNMCNFVEEPRTTREFTIYLPLYKPVKILGVGVDADATLESTAPFATAKPVVFYGTSITQGGAASRSGLSYEALLARKLNLDFVNLGFSGNGLGEPAVARAMTEIDAACFVLDFGVNHKTSAAMEKVYGPFVDFLRAKHPTTPIIAISPIYTSRELRNPEIAQDWQHRREFIRGVVEARVKAGDAHIYLIDGATLLDPARGDALVDGTHPNDLGFSLMAAKIGAKLKDVLALPGK